MQHHVIFSYDFFISSGTDGDSIISYRLRQTGYAGLPSWIGVTTTLTADSIILHGTPTEGDVGEYHLMVHINKKIGKTWTLGFLQTGWGPFVFRGSS